MKIKLAGRTNLKELFTQTDLLYAKQIHTPFLVFREADDEIEVQLVDRASTLSSYPRSTKVMVQWRGEWRSDFFQMTVGDVLDAMETNIAGEKAEDLRKATEVILEVGPKGGFRYLRYKTPASTMGVAEKERAELLIAFFEKVGIAVERRVQK